MRRSILRRGRHILTMGAIFAALLAAQAPQPALPEGASVPRDVLHVLSDAAETLVNDNPSGFLDLFDRDMPNYGDLRDAIERLLGANEVGSTIDVIRDEGDERKHTLELDWLLVIAEKNSISNQHKETRRRVLQCTMERKGKRWKITALRPIDLFR